MTTRKTKLTARTIALYREGTEFVLMGSTEKGVHHEIRFRVEGVMDLECAIRSLTERARELIREERRVHRSLTHMLGGQYTSAKSETHDAQ